MAKTFNELKAGDYVFYEGQRLKVDLVGDYLFQADGIKFTRSHGKNIAVAGKFAQLIMTPAQKEAKMRESLKLKIMNYFNKPTSKIKLTTAQFVDLAVMINKAK